MVAVRRINLIFIFSLIFLPTVHSEEIFRPEIANPMLEPWRWQNIPELTGKGFRCMAEANDGALWFGVDNGVYRYDGVEWILHVPENGLDGAPVVALCGASDGSIYAGTPNRISRFKDGSWQIIESQLDYGDPIDLHKNKFGIGG